MARTSLLLRPQNWGLGSLLALVLLAPAAHAQNLTLNSGDVVTVSGPDAFWTDVQQARMMDL